MVNLLPTDAELATFTDLNDIRTWAGLNDATWNVVNLSMGNVTHIRMLACLPQSVLLAHLSAVRIAPAVGDERALTAAESIQVGLMWRACRKCCGLPDVDPLEQQTATTSSPAAAAPSSKAPKKVKASSVIDQLDDTEISPLSRSELDQCFLNHIEVTGAEPSQEFEPTPEQVAALKDRVETRSEAPYADFSVFTPFGRRMQRQMRTKAWVFQPDGSFRTVEVPGPDSFSAWTACWKVYRSTLYMLRHQFPSPLAPKHVVTPAVMEEYYENIVKLNEEFPEAWHLIMQAEDRCRGEALDRYRRSLTKAQAEGNLPMGITFDASAPWIGCFQYAARDLEFWQKNVIRPPHTFLARGGKNMSAKNAERANMSKEALAALDKEASYQDSPTSRRKRKSAAANASTGHPRKWGSHYITDQDGTELCFRFAKGQQVLAQTLVQMEDHTDASIVLETMSTVPAHRTPRSRAKAREKMARLPNDLKLHL